MKKRKNLTHAQVLEIVSRYPNEPAAAIASDFSISILTVYKTAQRYNVKKSPDFLKSDKSGRIQKGQRKSKNTEFKKGNVPWSNGKKLPYKPGNLWKKGHKPHNTAKDGEIRWRPNPGYYFIRISEKNWHFLHRHIWEQQNGPIPVGSNVIFKDGNHQNCQIENLECISNEELAKRNSIMNFPPEYRQLIHARWRLDRAINKQQENE